LCKDHFLEDSFTNTATRGLKRSAVPIPFESRNINVSNEHNVLIESHNINKNNENKKRKSMIMEQVLHLQEARKQSMNNIASTSTTPSTSTVINLINENVMDEHPESQFIEQRTNSLRCYQPRHLNFNSSIDNEDLMEWMHIEPIYEKVLTPPSSNNNNNNNNTNIMESMHLEPSMYERVPPPPCNNKRNTKNRTETNTKDEIIHKLYAKVKSLRSENIRLRGQIRKLKYRLRYIPQKRKKSKKDKQKRIIFKKLIDEQDLHPVAKAMINLQLHIPNAPYTEEEKNLSRQLYYYSAAAFCRLRKAGCNFSGQRTIKRWLEEYDVWPGFCDFIFQKLKEKISYLPIEERVCALKWDEMAIKPYEEYSQKLDEIEGLVDLSPLRRKSERSKCVFVFCLDSLNARRPWRQPLAYFLPGKCMKAEEIILLKECLDKLNATGVDVQLLTCDQGTCNQSAYAQLGINPENPFFVYNGKKYNASFPHLVKRLLSFFRTHENLYCDGKIIASYSDFETTWSVDSATKGGSNLLSHITEAHIHPNNFESMNVKRAFQILSHTFAAAIKTAGHGKQLDTIT